MTQILKKTATDFKAF